MKSVDVVELRIRRNKKSIAGRLIKFLMDSKANRSVNFSGHNATKLALNTGASVFYALCFGGEWRSGEG